MYAEVMAEKESLKDLRDEVAVAIQLGRLEMTREVAERAIPNLGLPRQGGQTNPTIPINDVELSRMWGVEK